MIETLAFYVLGILLLGLVSGIRILNEYERGVIFRLGRMVDSRGPGIIYVIPFIERMQRIGLRIVTLDIPPQDIITRDNVSVRVNAVVYFRVLDPNRAVREVENHVGATLQLAQVILRSVCGSAQLDELLSERDKLNRSLQDLLDKQTDPWGIKVSLVELKDIDLPEELERVMARQARAERDRRAKVIHAEGEYQASQRLAGAAEILNHHPAGIQLRFLQTLLTVGSQNNFTTVVPIPVDLLKSFIRPLTRSQR